MKFIKIIFCMSVSVLIIAAIFAYAGQGDGIISDGTMQTTVSGIGTNTVTISDGTTAGTNLFHSFSYFNIETNQTAQFSANSDITNIINRITGNSNSWINGKISCSVAGADIYLINPNGIIFGDYASLDIQGSFYASTAHYLKMQDGSIFHTSTGYGDAIISSSPIESFGFINSDISDITFGENDDVITEIKCPNEKNITIIAGYIRSEAATLKTSGGNITMAAVASAGEVTITKNGIDTTCSELGSIELTEGTCIDVNNDLSKNRSGQVFIKGKTFLMDNSSLLAKNYGEIDAAFDIGISIEASDIYIQNGSKIATGVADNNNGDAGGNTTDIVIKAYNTLNLGAEDDDAESVISSEATKEKGDCGDIYIDVKYINIYNISNISSITEGTGSGGNINLTASKDVYISGDDYPDNSNTNILSDTLYRTNEAGDGGDIYISAENISLENGASIDSRTKGCGDSGDITLVASNYIHLGYGKIFEKTEVTPRVEYEDYNLNMPTGNTSGNSGTMTLEAENIFLENGGALWSKVKGLGQTSDVILKASDTILCTGEAPDKRSPSGIFSISSYQGELDISGDGSDIFLEAKNIILTDGGRVATITASTGQGGDITLNATESINIAGSVQSDTDYWYTSHLAVETNRQGEAGSIYVTTPNIYLADNASIYSHSKEEVGVAEDEALQKAGNLYVYATEGLYIDESRIYTESLYGGGNITIEPGKFLSMTDSSIYTDILLPQANEANILIQPTVLYIENSTIKTEATVLETSGNINIESAYIFSIDSIYMEREQEIYPEPEHLEFLDYDKGLDTDIQLIGEYAKIRYHCPEKYDSGLIINKLEALPVSFEDSFSSMPTVLNSTVFKLGYNNKRKGYITPFEHKKNKDKSIKRRKQRKK